MRKNCYTIDTWEICGFEPDTYKRDALVSGLYGGMEWIKTQTPKDVHSILIENNIIPDPYYKSNDLDCLWVEKKIWVYKSEFTITEDTDRGSNLEIIFEGLDTYAAVILNGKEIATFENMLIEHALDITDHVSIGKNMLLLEFDVMGTRAMEKGLPNGFWTNYSTERAYARKASYQYGWDWTSRIATVGLWKPIKLISYGNAKINSVHIITQQMKIDKREATLHIEIDSTVWHKSEFTYQVEITSPEGEVTGFLTKDTIFDVQMEDVCFWWTHDLGRPDLYQITVTMLENKLILDTYSCEYGIRKLELILSSEDKKDKRFLFELNGVPVMARGANWVPVSNFLSTAEDRRYIRLIQMSKRANMNMLNIWGGGIYEKDIFYQTCDREGILVWHYLMFVCGEYPDFDEDYIKSVKEEVEKAVTRLRNYACIALWVGNVEGDMLSEKISLPREMYGNNLFKKLIPAWLKAIDPVRSYIPTSPWSSTGPANDMESGDRHNWDVWFTNVEYTEYSADTTRFASEYGIHAAPVKQTIERYIGSENAQMDNFYFKYMNKDQSLGRMYYYMKQHIGEPKDIDEYIDYSMFVQAEGLKYGSEHYRRNFPATSGALIWQLNDCMPVQSWSLIDYDLIPKASYYYAKRFFAPAAISLEEIDDTLTGVWVHNNCNEELHEVIRIEVKDFLGNRFHWENLEIHIPAHKVEKVKEIRVGGRYYPNVIIPNRTRMFYIMAEGKNTCLRNIRYFSKYQETAFPRAHITAEYDNDILRIHTDYFARFVKIDGKLRDLTLSDNYFDMEAGETREICVEGTVSGLYVKALNSKAEVLFTE